MAATTKGGAKTRAADTLGLPAPAFHHLRDSLESGEFPLWLRIGDPLLAGRFDDAFAFEILCEKARLRAGFERRAENLRAACEKAGRQDLVDALQDAADEGDLEDIGFAVSAASSEDVAPPEDPEESAAAEGLDAYLAKLKLDYGVASRLRRSFREHATIRVTATDKEGVERKPFQSLIDWTSPLATVPPAKYLQIRRGERAHAIQLDFDWPAAELARLAEETGGFPPQERDKYLQAFANFARQERMPRYVQEARASLKRTAETEALRNAWEQVDFALNRGRHSGPVLGLCAARGGKVQAALVDAHGEFLGAALLQPKGSGWEGELRRLLGEHRPELIAYQGDTASRNFAQRLAKGLPTEEAAAEAAPEAAPAGPEAAETADAAPAAPPPAPEDPGAAETPETSAAPAEESSPSAGETAEASTESASAEVSEPAPVPPQPKPAPRSAAKKRAAKPKLRQAHVPMAVARTLQREVARRGAETLLSHDERTAYLVARFAWDPRGAALATPHVVRAFISFRGEVNPRRMEEFEVTFLRALLADRGVDLNEAPLQVLRMVPGLDAEGTVIERSTAPFLSIEDFLDRMAPGEREARALLCLARVRGSANPLDSRPLHPVYERPLRQAAAAAGLELAALVREPQKVLDLDWDEILSERGWHKSVVGRIRQGLERSVRRRRRGAPQGGRPGAPRGARRGKGLDTLEVGSKLSGKVTAVTEYGAFVDVGARTDGLVHISEMSDEFVEDPKQVLSVGQAVEARVVSVDLEKQRFRLSLRSSDKPRAERGGGGGGGGRRGEPREPDAPAHVRSTRPRGGGGRGGRGGPGGPGGGRGRGGPGGPGGRGDGRRGGGRGGRREDDYGKDPKAAKKEEIDPTNPFFQFFSQKDEDGEQKQD